MSNHLSRLMAVPDPAAALRHHTAGIDAHFAAVDLLIDHSVFLGRSAFREEFVTALNQHRLPFSNSEANIRRVVDAITLANGSRIHRWPTTQGQS